jgi:hypothetical protein
MTIWIRLLDLVVFTDFNACVTLIPFIILLTNVLGLHTSAGVSRHFVGFSCAGSALLTIASTRYSLIFVYIIRSIVTLILFLAVRFKYPLKSEQFRDAKHTVMIIPISVVLSLVAFYDRNLRAFLFYLGAWFAVFGIGCQVLVTKKSRRITVFKTHFPYCLGVLLPNVYGTLARAFLASGSEMWMLWLTGMTKLMLLIDLTYYVVYAKQRNDDFELPGGFDL